MFDYKLDVLTDAEKLNILQNVSFYSASA